MLGRGLTSSPGDALRLFSVSSGFAAGREEELGDRLGRILRDIRIPEKILAQIQESLVSDKGQEETNRAHEERQLDQRLVTVGQLSHLDLQTPPQAHNCRKLCLCV